MPKKCIVPKCRTNYRDRTGKTPCSDEKIPVFRFPKSNDELNTWIRAIPYKNLQVGKDSAIFEKHWPESYPTVSKKG